jgi:hypothetical protein
MRGSATRYLRRRERGPVSEAKAETSINSGHSNAIDTALRKATAASLAAVCTFWQARILVAGRGAIAHPAKHRRLAGTVVDLIAEDALADD